MAPPAAVRLLVFFSGRGPSPGAGLTGVPGARLDTEAPSGPRVPVTAAPRPAPRAWAGPPPITIPAALLLLQGSLWASPSVTPPGFSCSTAWPPASPEPECSSPEPERSRPCLPGRYALGVGPAGRLQGGANGVQACGCYVDDRTRTKGIAMPPTPGHWRRCQRSEQLSKLAQVVATGECPQVQGRVSRDTRVDFTVTRRG